MKTDPNGQAFPLHVNPHAPAFPADSRENGTFSGLSKRELFAAMAIQGLVPDGNIAWQTSSVEDDHGRAQIVPDDSDRLIAAVHAHIAVLLADALIAALNGPQEKS